MNLMFWKKKSGVAKEAETARDPLEAATVKLDDGERGADTPDQGSSPPKPAAKPGLAARMKLRLLALIPRSRKKTAFRADGIQVAQEPGGAEKTNESGAAETALTHPDLETLVKPRLTVRIKLRLIALARRFKKKPAADAGDAPAAESSAQETHARPGLLKRFRAGLAAFAREFKAPPASEEHYADSRDHSEAAPEGQHPDDEFDAEPVAHSSRHLFIGGAVGMLVFLLLSGAVIALWPLIDPPQKRWGTKHDITTLSSRASQPVSAFEALQAEIEALRRANAELHAKIEALKKGGAQPLSHASPAYQAGGDVPPPAVNGEITASNSDPKANAMSLKEAIEAMNDGTGDYRKKPPK